MTGGLKKTTSRLAIATIASVVASGAFAADLGGNCCADLEERVAELEATAARKGNRKVKLTVSGQVNEALIFWDDGSEKNVYVVSNNNSRTRFRFVGDAKISNDWSAGYLLEIGIRYANSGNRNQGTDRAGGELDRIDIRHSAWWMERKDLGRVWLGETSSATDGITEINLANVNTVGPGADAWQSGFFLRNSNGTLSTKKWDNVSPGFVGEWNAGEGDRNNVVKYVSPTWQGFTASAAWGEDDMWDVALRYAGEFNGVRIAAGIGYKEMRDNIGKSGADGPACADLNPATSQSAIDCNNLGLSASIMHVPTGIYGFGSWGRTEDKNRQALFGAAVKDEDKHWYLQGGIEQNWFGIGKTTLYGEYGKYETGAGITSTGTVGAFAAADIQGGQGRLASSDLQLWGLGINQEISAAAMDLYLSYRHFEADLKTSVSGTTAGAVSAPVKDFDAVMMGAIIRF